MLKKVIEMTEEDMSLLLILSIIAIIILSLGVTLIMIGGLTWLICFVAGIEFKWLYVVIGVAIYWLLNGLFGRNK